MTLRLPQPPSPGGAVGAGLSGLERELQAERASSLGRCGRDVEEALEALRNASDRSPALRSMLIAEAAHAVWRYFVQREACGLRRHDDAIATYAIPNEVLARVGAGTP